MSAAQDFSHRQELPDGAVLFRTGRGELAYKIVGRVLFLAVGGTFELPALLELLDALDRLSRAGHRPLVVCDNTHLGGFTPEVRERLGAWSRDHAREADALVLVRSKIFRMVVSVLAMIARNPVEFFDDPRDLEVALRRALPRGVSDPQVSRHLSARKNP